MARSRRIVIPGGSGYLGRVLAAALAAQGWDVVILTRHPQPPDDGVRVLPWDGTTLGPWLAVLDGAEAVINLAGRTVNCRYHARNRQQIYDSRLHSTRIVGQAIAACAQPPRSWLNASSATIYRHAVDHPQDEYSGEVGTGFSVDVCRQWEWTLWNVPTPQTRKVALRAAMVLGRGEGGVLNVFENLVRLGLGGTLGPGTQYMSWLHVDDFVRSVLFLLEHAELAGPVNLSAPEPLPNAEFMRALRRACGMRFGMPANRPMLEVGALVLRTETELLLKSRRVVPRRLLAAGFDFHFPTVTAALADLLHAPIAERRA